MKVDGILIQTYKLWRSIKSFLDLCEKHRQSASVWKSVGALTFGFTIHTVNISP